MFTIIQTARKGLPGHPEDIRKDEAEVYAILEAEVYAILRYNLPS